MIYKVKKWGDLIVKFNRKMLLILSLLIVGVFIFKASTSLGASSPYDVESSVKSGWANLYGGKRYAMESGRKLVYDVYANKYTSGGYSITWRDFGKGNQPYINFQGWAILFGHKRHTSTNHETYIVARKVGGDSGVGTTYVYGTTPINLSASEELEYNNSGPGSFYNECSSTATNRNNEDCNMRYDNVGFNAYLPLQELFPNQYEQAQWKLYIVKRVDSQIVYTELKLPFTFSNRSYNGGDIDLTSGINASNLEMVGTNVIRRTQSRQSGVSGWDLGYFTTYKVYTRNGHDESGTSVWYSVKSPEDGYATRWASTAYWDFGGSQAQINYTPPPDTDPPSHISHSLSGARYQNGNDYWVQPNDDVWVRLRQHDATANLYQYLRLDGTPYGTSVDSRALHDFTQAWNQINHWDKDPNVLINAASREENTNYGRVAWQVIPYTHGHTYNVQYYYRDTQNNTIGYNNTGMRLRVDGVAPTHVSHIISGYRYQNGDDYWVRPNDQVYVTFRQYDPHSGNKFQYLSLYGSGVDVRSQHVYSFASNDNNQFAKSPNVQINSALREEDTTYGRVKWGIVPKTHGDGYNVQYYYTDNVDNTRGYIDTGMDLWTDGAAPAIQFRNYSDTSDFFSRGWSTAAIDVRLKYSDPHSGYKRSRYAWSTSTVTPTTWSAWSTSSNYVVSNSSYGQWYLHVQAEDNVGNIVTTYKGTYNFNNPPNADFTESPNPTDRTKNVCFTNKSTDPNGNALTYDWDYRKKGTTTWINMSTTTNPCFKFSEVTTYEVRLIATDSNGASDSLIRDVVVVNLPPVAQFKFDKSTYYIGDTMQITTLAYDPDGDAITHYYEITKPNNVKVTFNTPNFSYIPDIPGYYTFKQTVTDTFGASDTATSTIYVNDLTLKGYVKHTPEWVQKHTIKGNTPNQFYSGEKFILEADVTAYPITYLNVKFDGYQVNGNLYTSTVSLPYNTPTFRNGELFDSTWVEGGTQLANGTAIFSFEVKYSNGIVKRDTVQVEIIGSVFDVFRVHKKF